MDLKDVDDLIAIPYRTTKKPPSFIKREAELLAELEKLSIEERITRLEGAITDSFAWFCILTSPSKELHLGGRAEEDAKKQIREEWERLNETAARGAELISSWLNLRGPKDWHEREQWLQRVWAAIFAAEISAAEEIKIRHKGKLPVDSCTDEGLDRFVADPPYHLKGGQKYAADDPEWADEVKPGNRYTSANIDSDDPAERIEALEEEIASYYGWYLVHTFQPLSDEQQAEETRRMFENWHVLVHANRLFEEWAGERLKTEDKGKLFEEWGDTTGADQLPFAVNDPDGEVRAAFEKFIAERGPTRWRDQYENRDYWGIYEMTREWLVKRAPKEGREAWLRSIWPSFAAASEATYNEFFERVRELTKGDLSLDAVDALVQSEQAQLSEEEIRAHDESLKALESKSLEVRVRELEDRISNSFEWYVAHTMAILGGNADAPMATAANEVLEEWFLLRGPKGLEDRERWLREIEPIFYAADRASLKKFFAESGTDESDLDQLLANKGTEPAIEEPPSVA